MHHPCRGITSTNSVTDLPKWPSLLSQPQLLIYPTRPIENTPTQTHAKREHRQYDNEIMTRLAWIAAVGRGGDGDWCCSRQGRTGQHVSSTARPSEVRRGGRPYCVQAYPEHSTGKPANRELADSMHTGSGGWHLDHGAVKGRERNSFVMV